MSLFEEAGSVVSLKEAKQFIENYNERYPDGIKAYLVSKANVEKILSQEGCMGIKIYNGFDTASNQNNLVLIGVDSEAHDMDKGAIIERLYRF